LKTPTKPRKKNGEAIASPHHRPSVHLPVLTRPSVAGFNAPNDRANHPNFAKDLNNLALLLMDTDGLEEAEPVMRRALAIDERAYGADHPRVATGLNNLAQLLQATNRSNEAKPLMRCHVEIFLKFTSETGHQHPRLKEVLDNYASLLQAMGRSDAEVRQELTDLVAKYGMSLE
jgi:hypothetical protein